MPNAARAGVSSGSSTRSRICTCPAPSMRAASTSSRGMSRMKLCSRKTASGIAKTVCESQTVQKVPARSTST